MSGHDVERAYIAARLDQLAAGRDQTLEEIRAEVDRLRESWAGGYDQQRAGHEGRMQAMRDETRAWLRSIYDDEADEPASPPNVGQGQADAFLGSSPASPPGPGPVQPNPHEAGLAAEDIKNMPMSEYAARRTSLGVQSPESMNRLFG